MINSEQNETHVTLRDVQTITSIHSVPPLGAMEARILAYKRSLRCRMPSCNRLSQASCTRWHNSAMVVAGSGEKVPASSRPIRVQWATDLGIMLARAVVHHEEHVTSKQPHVDMRYPAEKHITFLSNKWQ